MRLIQLKPRGLLVLGLVTLTALIAWVAPAGAQPGVSYEVPPDNPFVGQAGAAPEMYSYGLRNPFRFSFDRTTGDLTIGDVGQGAKEEIDFAPVGQGAADNYGWDCKEGTIAGPSNCDPPDHVPPVREYDNPPASLAAVTGGYVVRDPSLPSFTGQYFYGDFFAGNVLSTTLSAGSSTTPGQDTGVDVAKLVSFGEDGAGGMHAVSLDGPVYRLQEDTTGALQKSALPATNFSAPIFVTAPAGDPRLFVVERAGRVIVRSGGTDGTFLDITAQVYSNPNTEGGMWSMAFPPDYASSGRFYVSYSDLGGDVRVDEFRRSAADPNVADPASQRPVLTVEHSWGLSHYGGQLQFGPDGMLYVSTGDGGGENDPDNNGQNLGTLLGKLLRIDPVPSAGAATASGAGSAAGQTSVDLRDRLPPFLRTRFPGRQQVVRQGGVIGYVRSNESGLFRALARVSVPGESRVFRLRGILRTVVAGRRYRVRLRLRRSARRAVARALARRRRVSVRVELRARDRAGNLTKTRLRVRARR